MHNSTKAEKFHLPINLVWYNNKSVMQSVHFSVFILSMKPDDIGQCTNPSANWLAVAI